MRRTINWKIILSNISEAREQLEEIEKKVNSGTPPSKEEFQIDMKHAYHHLNFAWNCRHVPTHKYVTLSSEDFNQWGEFPKDLEEL